MQEPKILERKRSEPSSSVNIDLILIQNLENNNAIKPDIIPPIVNDFSNYNTQISEIPITNLLHSLTSDYVAIPKAEVISLQKTVDNGDLINGSINENTK